MKFVGALSLSLSISFFLSVYWCVALSLFIFISIASICKYWKFVSIKFLLNELKSEKGIENMIAGRIVNAFSSQTALNESYKLLN